MRITVPPPVKIWFYGTAGEKLSREVEFVDFFAETVLPLLGKGAKDALRNARLYETVSSTPVGESFELQDGLFLEIRNALSNAQMNQAVAFRLAPFIILFVEE